MWQIFKLLAGLIPDPQASEALSSAKRPFDGFSYMPEYIVNFESKLNNGYSAFAFSHIRPHQVENLLRIKEVTKNYKTKCLNIIILGVYLYRKGFDLFFFDIDYIVDLMKDKKSILKKELENMRDEGKFLRLEKQKFDVNKVPEKVIYAR